MADYRRLPEEEPCGQLPVVRVAQDRGESEEQYADGEQIREQLIDRGERCSGQSDAVLPLVRVLSGDDDGQCGHGADNHRVNEWFPCRNEAFLGWSPVLGGRVRHACGSCTGDIGEQGSLDADDGHTDDTALDAVPGECALEDEAEGPRNLAEVAEENDQDAAEVPYRHAPYDAAGQLALGLMPPKMAMPVTTATIAPRIQLLPEKKLSSPPVINTSWALN